MTDKAVEAMARAIDPLAFEEWKHAPRGLEFASAGTLRNEQERRQHVARRKAAAALAALLATLPPGAKMLERKPDGPFALIPENAMDTFGVIHDAAVCLLRPTRTHRRYCRNSDRARHPLRRDCREGRYAGAVCCGRI